MKKVMLILGLCACAMAMADVVVYPQYPAAIERDGEYVVSVTQGNKTNPLVVYNHCEKSPLNGRTHGGDVNRRFCEFSFDGEPVRVDIRVSRDVKCYKVFPSRHALKSEFKDGVISVWLNKPVYFGIQLNDYDKTILSVFADAPEKAGDIPAKSTPGIMYVEGWVDAPGTDGVITITNDIKEIYLSPGSVLNARLKIKSPGLKLHGRGMVLDPMSDIFRYDQTKNTNRGVINANAANVTMEGIKMVDARTFNYICTRPGCVVQNVKMMSSMMCTDGLTICGHQFRAENCWLYVGDNTIVASSTRNSVFKDIAIGTSCNAIFPQGTNLKVVMENIDVFRADEGLIKNVYNAVLRRNNKWSEMNGGMQKKEPGPQELSHQANEFYFKNLSAVDCTLFSHFFVGHNMGTLPKTFAFDGCSVPGSTGRDHYSTIGKKDGIAIDTWNNPNWWLITSNYQLSFTNLWIDGARAQFPSKSIVGWDALKFSYANTDAPRTVPLMPNRHEVSWKAPEKAKRVVKPGTNILAEEPKTRSIWQRMPSWLVKFEATQRDEKGAVIYRLVQCEKNAGMSAMLTEDFKACGNDKWKFAFDVRTRSETPFDLKFTLASNEKKIAKEMKLLENPSPDKLTDWKRCEVEFNTEFDLAVTELVYLTVTASSTADVIEFRNMSFSR